MVLSCSLLILPIVPFQIECCKESGNSDSLRFDPEILNESLLIIMRDKMQATFYKSDEQEREEARKRTGEFGPRLEWSELELGMVISAFNYGQVRT